MSASHEQQQAGEDPRSPEFAGPAFDRLRDELKALTADLEAPGAWPEDQFARLAETSVPGWVIPREYGGIGISVIDLTTGYEWLAAACLTTTFVLTQRNGACQRIVGSENESLKAELLPRLSAGEIFATVGISHLTTSSQHLAEPAVRIRHTDGGFVLNGRIPWVTGAAHADYVLTGGTFDDNRQALVIVPASTSGITIEPAPRLLALNASQTGSIRLEDVELEAKWLVSGPVSEVMKQGQGGGPGSLTTSALAVGAAESSLNGLRQEATKRPELNEIIAPLQAERVELSSALHAAARGDAADKPPLRMGAETIRKRANSLVLRTSQAYLGACKGAGFVAGHPAERAVREAMFFLVWSCPQPVLTAALREFACLFEGD